jgi:hypothetical protein
MLRWPSLQTGRDAITIVVSIPDEITQRKGAKNAKLYKITSKKTGISPAMNQILFFVNYLCELCELCVFAVKTLFMDERYIVKYGRTGCLEKSVSRVVFTDIMFVFSANSASLR